MQATMGKRFESEEFDSSYMITKGGAFELSCTEAVDGEANALGKRYADSESGVVVLCIKSGRSQICCAGRPMGLLAAKVLPSSD
jgi:hypothetical protein